MIKRIYLTILVMLFALPGLFAQAPKISIGHVEADPGEVLVPVYMENFSDLAAMTIHIEIDNEVVDFVGLTNTAFEGFVAEPKDNGISIVWVKPIEIPFTGEDNPEDGHLLDLRLEYRGGFITELNFIADECEFTNASLGMIEGVVFEGGSISPDGFAGTVAMTNKGATIGGTVFMPVTIGGEGFDAVSSFSLFIEFNPTQLDFTEVIPAEGVTNITASESGGVINVMWTGDPTDFNELEGPVVEIELVYKGGGSAPLRFKGTSEVTANLGVLSTEFIDGAVFLDVPAGSAELTIEDVFVFMEEIDTANESFVDVAIHANDFASTVGSVNLVIGFNSTQVAFETATSDQLVGLNVNASGNRINIAWANTTGVDIEDGELIVLTFAYRANQDPDTEEWYYHVDTPLTFEGGSDLQTPALASIPVAFNNGSLIVTDEGFELVLIADPEEGGEVIGAGFYGPDEVAEVDAIANEGYGFVNWTAPDGTLVSEEAANPITMTEDLTLVANFEMLVYNLTLVANPEDGGEVIGAGEYTLFDEIQVNAIAAEGYEFVNWTDEDGEEVSGVASNTLEGLSSDLTLTANFEALTYTLTLVADPEEGGEVIGTGTYTMFDEIEVDAVPAEGYAFVHWLDEDGEVFAEEAANVLPGLTEDLTLTAVFEVVYTLTLLVSPEGAGTVVGAGTYRVDEEVEVDAIANEGFVFVNWTDADGEEVSTSPDNVIEMPAADLTLTANFEATYNVTFNVNMMYVDGIYHRATFNPDNDVVYVTGSMFGWQSPGDAPELQTLAPTTEDPMIYTNTVQVAPGDYAYKYFLNAGWDNGEWDGGDDRTFSVVDQDVVLNDWFGYMDDPTNVSTPEAMSLNVFPNPARTVVNIESGQEILEVRMMDMLGQVVYTSPVNSYRTQLSVSELQNGIYFIQVLTSEGFATQRVQVTK